MATSNAIGTGRNPDTSAIATIPITVTLLPERACWGRSSTARAPSMAARIIRGNATRNTVQKLLTYDPAALARACPQVTLEGISTAKLNGGSDSPWRAEMNGTKTRIRNRTVASFRSAIGHGNNGKVIA